MPRSSKARASPTHRGLGRPPRLRRARHDARSDRDLRRLPARLDQTIRPRTGGTLSGAGEDIAPQHRWRGAQQIDGDALQHGACIGRGREVAAIAQLIGPQPRPVGNHPPARQRTTRKEGDGGGAVIRTDVPFMRAVRPNSVIGDHDRVPPGGPSPCSNAAKAPSRPPSSSASRRGRPRWHGCPSRRRRTRRCGGHRLGHQAAPRRSALLHARGRHPRSARHRGLAPLRSAVRNPAERLRSPGSECG